jgi:hypothetical protein
MLPRYHNGSYCARAAPQGEVARSLTDWELQQEWAAAWEQGAQQAQVYVQAQLQGGVWVTSRSYTRHQTRNGSRVLVNLTASGGSSSSSNNSSGVRPRVAEVEYYVRLQQLGDSSDVIVFAMLRVLKTSQ